MTVKKRLIMLMGPQASGKTTWIKDFIKNYNKENWIVIASDHYWPRCPVSGLRYWIDKNGIKRSWGLEPIAEQAMSKAWKFAHNVFLDTLAYGEGRPILWEATFPARRDRKTIIDIADYHDYTVECVCLYPKLAVCASRNDERPDRVPDIILARTYASIQLPSKEEGFKYVTIIKDPKERK